MLLRQKLFLPYFMLKQFLSDGRTLFTRCLFSDFLMSCTTYNERITILSFLTTLGPIHINNDVLLIKLNSKLLDQ